MGRLRWTRSGTSITFMWRCRSRTAAIAGPPHTHQQSPKPSITAASHAAASICHSAPPRHRRHHAHARDVAAHHTPTVTHEEDDDDDGDWHQPGRAPVSRRGQENGPATILPIPTGPSTHPPGVILSIMGASVGASGMRAPLLQELLADAVLLRAPRRGDDRRPPRRHLRLHVARSGQSPRPTPRPHHAAPTLTCPCTLRLLRFLCRRHDVILRQRLYQTKDYSASVSNCQPTYLQHIHQGPIPFFTLPNYCLGAHRLPDENSACDGDHWWIWFLLHQFHHLHQAHDGYKKDC